MELRVNDYVRTKSNGIQKIYEEGRINLGLIRPPFRIIKEEELLKSSPNIIDLIEVGDIVKYGLLGGGMVIFKKDDEITTNTILFSNLKEKDIKKIITKEQIENMEYEVK